MKRLYVVLSVVLILSMLAACKPAPAAETAAPAEPTTLRVWIEWGDNPAQLQSLFDKYAAANNVKIEVTAPVESDKYLAALSGSEPPDVLVLSGGDNVKSYYKEGLVLAYNDLIEKAGIDINDVYEAPLSVCKQGDTILCLPWGNDVYALFWNKDLFEEAGLDPEAPPKTMEELVEMADKLTVKDADGKITQIGFIPDFSWSHADLYVRMFGGFWYNDDATQVTINSQPMLDSLLWQQQFYTKYGPDNVMQFTSALGGYMSPDQGFYAGKVAMMVDGEWQTGPNFISKYKPELNYGVAAFPPPADHPELANTVVVQGTVVVIPNGVKNPEASAKLVAWMMSPEIMAEEMLVNFNLPTSKKAAADPRFMEHPKFKIFMDLLANPNAKPVITSPITAEMVGELGTIEEQILHAGADPAPMLEELQAKYAPKLEEALK